MTDGRPQRLYREPDDKKIAGVCSGLADYFGLDPTVVRLAAVVIGVATGVVGLVAYVTAAIVMPVRPETVARVQAPGIDVRGGLGKSNALLISVLVVALLVLAGGRWSWWWFEPPILGAGLVAVGIWLLLSREERQVQQASAPVATKSDPPSTVVDDPVAAGPQDEIPPPIPVWGPAAPPPRRSAQFPIGVLALLLIVAGIVALLAVFEVWDLSVEEALGVALLVIGAALVVGAWRRDARMLIALGLPTLGLLVFAHSVDLPLDGGMGDREVVVATMAELQDLDDTQELLAGELLLDLSDAPLGRAGAPTPRLNVDVGMGSLVVRLPEDATAELDVEVGAGSTRIDGRDEDGVDIDRSEVLDGDPGGGRIVMDLHVGLGEVEVTRG